MQHIWTLKYFFSEECHHIWQILLVLCKSHVALLKTHLFQFPNYSVIYPRYLIFPIHWFEIHKTLSFYYPENLTLALFFLSIASWAPPPNPKLYSLAFSYFHPSISLPTSHPSICMKLFQCVIKAQCARLLSSLCQKQRDKGNKGATVVCHK